VSLAIAIQGELGSNSELAVREYFPDSTDLVIVPCRTFDELFDAVHDGRAQAAMAPVENSLAGSIHDVWRLLADRPLPVSGEIRLRIDHCLIGLPGTDLAQIRRVRSHPQALAQCQQFLHALPDVEVEAVYDTAGAVKMLGEEGGPQDAAIASAQAAMDHGMEIIAHDLSTGVNYTRFLVLGDVDMSDSAADADLSARADNKTTLVLQVGEMAAGLASIITILREQNLDLLKLETHKRAGVAWVYDVYLEFAGHVNDAGAKAAVEKMIAVADELSVIGSYPSGHDAEPRMHRRR
jgi:prephenate dehydratase